MLQRVKINDPVLQETRNLVRPIEVRAAGEAGSAFTVGGYSAKYNDPIELMDWWGEEFVEVIAPGAFDRTLRENLDVRALRNHDSNLILGRGKNGTLRLWSDEVGLRFEVDLNLDTTAGRDTRADIERGDIDGCSFGFYVIGELPPGRMGGKTLRTITDIELIEITPACTFPANERTEVAPILRSRKPRFNLRSRAEAEYAHRLRLQQIEDDE